MAITKAIPKIWSARILDSFQKTNVWAGSLTDVSGELTDGDSLSLTKVTSSVTVKDYTRNTDIAAAELLTDADEVLNINKLKYFNIAMDDVDRVQTRPDLLSHFALLAGRSVSKQSDDDIYATILAGAVAARRENVANITDSSTEANLLAFINSVQARAMKLRTEEAYPAESTRLIFAGDVYRLIVKWLTLKGVIGTGNVNSAAFTSGALGNLFGFQTSFAPNLVTAATANRAMAWFLHREAGVFAGQIRQIEPYRMEKRFADAIKGLFVYGSKIVDSSKLYLIRQT